ncbi:olfactory receptor 6N2-like [Pyxicephalus adspersus]|uniref:olfactory receptor 6N2-like n=1 Tax=Pyxicephalus adspersus TaxID=30357 RepID=UPI003B5B4B9D
MFYNTTVSEFIITGFPALYHYNSLLFVCLLIVYLLIITGNVTICVLVKTDLRLHSPMYIFISALSFLEIFYTAVTIPKMLVNLLIGNKTISVRNCLLQTYFFHSLGSCENCLLTAMAYDRYLAICLPLYYSSIMTSTMTMRLVGSCFTLGFLFPLTEILLISRLSFCNSKMEHIFCDIPPLISLACGDTSINILANFVTNCFSIAVNFSLVMSSYFRIIMAVIKIKTSAGRMKAFSTCVSHLTVVLIFFTCILFMYIRLSKSYSLYFDRAVSILYSVVTPILNPVIYSFRNQEIRNSLRAHVLKSLFFKHQNCCREDIKSLPQGFPARG